MADIEFLREQAQARLDKVSETPGPLKYGDQLNSSGEFHRWQGNIRTLEAYLAGLGGLPAIRLSSGVVQFAQERPDELEVIEDHTQFPGDATIPSNIPVQGGE